MKKADNYFLSLLYLFISLGCSNDEVDTNFSPPQLLQGTWVSPVEDFQYMKLTIKKTNIIEENYELIYSNLPYIDFVKEYDSNDYIITETIEESSYEFTIKRKDGGIIDEQNAITSIYRGYRLVNYDNQMVLELRYAGTSGAYLVRE